MIRSETGFESTSGIEPAITANEFFQILFDLRRPGIEPGPHAWKARILTIELSALHIMIRQSPDGFVLIWRTRVSIPVPRRCERRALPIELVPHHQK